MTKRTVCLLIAVALLSVTVAGCAQNVPEETESSRLLTPLAPGQIADRSSVPKEDNEAFNTFFSRWGAYVAAVGTTADKEETLYSDLLNLSRHWQECVTIDNLDGDARVLMYLPESPGLLEVNAQGGWLNAANLSYNTQDAPVEAGLAFTIACNALVYALAWEDDMIGVSDVYNQCMRELNESGAEMAGTSSYNGYEFSLTMDPDTHYMTFAAVGQTE